MDRTLRRPPSYSDSFIVLSGKQTELEPLKSPLLRRDSGFFIESPPPLEPSILQSPSIELPVPQIIISRPHSPAEKWFNRIMSLGVHITLISLFETIFFFQFVSVSEDTGLKSTIDSYVNNILTTCKNWTSEQHIVINDILSVLVNVTQVDENGSIASSNRHAFNSSLHLQSWMYFVGLLSTIIVTGFLGSHASLRIAYKRILVENLIMVTLLGLYEWTFFETIIYNYENISPPEIDQFVVGQLQTTCNLLTYNNT
uniref:Uncharacterized protein n=1 Tax=viral metagenome TaxID=1070528 RepID=A0A6C0DI13_9ZZZZ